jgi:protein-tyrosine phosphatase
MARRRGSQDYHEIPCKTGDSVSMSGRVDLHFHLLPGVDDGPAGFYDSIELAREAVAQGTDTVVTTPHVRGDYVTDVWELRARVIELRARLAEAGVPLAVVRGGELGHDMVGRLGQDELESIAQGPPGARWLLLEAPWAPYGESFHAAATELRDRGFGVVIAHPERSADAELDGAAGLRRELAAGARAQVNAMSLTGGHGEAAQAAAFALVDDDLVALVASDAHGPTRPPHLLAAEHALVAYGVEPREARRLTQGEPLELLGRGLPGARTPLAA